MQSILVVWNAAAGGAGKPGFDKHVTDVLLGAGLQPQMIESRRPRSACWSVTIRCAR